MTFYFSRGIIKTLKTKKSLFVESVGRASSVASTIRFQETMIVQVSNICIITDKDQVEIVLNDTESSSNFFIDKNILRQYDTNKKQISAGSVIILKDLSFLKSTTNEYIISITDFALIGWLAIENSIIQNEAILTQQTVKIVDKDNIIPIRQLNLSLNNQDWSIKAELCNRTGLKEFNSKSTNQKRSFIRLLFGDATGYIEAVAFEEKAIELEKLELGKVYVISKGDFQAPSQKGYRSWPEQKHLIQLDLHLKNNSTVRLVPNYKIWLESKIPKESPIKKRSLASINDSDEEEQNPKSKKLTRFEKARQMDSKIMEQEKITRINALITHNFESFVNVIGLIAEVGQLSNLERMEKKPIALRKFKLVDQSKTTVSVALWGKQASEFNLATGEILLLRRVKMTNYGGLSLSIMKCTEVNVLPENYCDQEVIELRKWWNETWWKSRQQESYVSVNSILAKKKLDNH